MIGALFCGRKVVLAETYYSKIEDAAETIQSLRNNNERSLEMINQQNDEIQSLKARLAKFNQ